MSMIFNKKASLSPTTRVMLVSRGFCVNSSV